MNAVSIPGSEELEVLSPSCIEIVQMGHQISLVPVLLSAYRSTSYDYIRPQKRQEECRQKERERDEEEKIRSVIL
uniref:Uncharacterized protein n=1 Tax=Araneus ventricosus TaxID=182803 RepID=A0A4Y1ZTI8_ARAVE|nr:hypothetical protein AVEN_19518-1 [Araneus ventricosus]GBL66446.1 hypothetical protein AVEN_25562-1 [Araneus ventricosus]GBL66477.1 hypothetical protein AVEN_170743-1 [Araneus ventricosus]